MYSQHFGLTQDPFSIAPDPRYLFMSERHREALAHLLFGVSGRGDMAGTGGGFVLLTGEIGTGKTTICRCFLEQIPPACHVAFIFNPKLTVTELLQSICDEFHIALPDAAAHPPSVKDYIDALNEFLLASHAAGQSSVLIIDEAQNLSADVLEQLRLLTNLETSERKLLQIVLIGQPELRTMLERPELEQLAQRVIARFHLDTLSEPETRQYVAHRLAVAGSTGPLPFDDRSLGRIHHLARGVPRRINLLCGRALLGAWANGLDRVDRAVVDKAAAEVFGIVGERTRPGGTRRTAYAVGGVVAITAAAAGALLLWPQQKSSDIATQASTAPLAANASAGRTAGPPDGGAPIAPTEVALPGRAESPDPAPPEALDALLPLMPHDMNAAWRELAASWNVPAAQADPCATASAHQIQCYRATNLTLPLLRQLDRPGILTLQVEKNPPAYPLLVGLNDETATLRMADGVHTVRLVALGRAWRGDFATYWRPPPGYSPDLRDNSTGPAIEHLAAGLDALDGVPARVTGSPPQVLDAALRARVRAFQRAQGLTPDGQPGPMTFMQLDTATGTTQPRLQTGPN